MKSAVFFLLLFLISYFSPQATAQDSVRIIILSDKVGASINKDERDYYHLFTRFKNFKEAVFFQNRDSLYYCKVKFSEGNISEDTLMTVIYSTIINTASRIEYFDELNSGEAIDSSRSRVKLKYESGLMVNAPKEMEIAAAGSNIKVKESVPIRRRGLLPIKKTDYADKSVISNPYRFGASVGILYNNCKYEGLSALYNELEEKIPEDPYTVPQSHYNFSNPAIIKISVNFLISEHYMIEINSNFTFKKEEYEMKYRAISGNLGYLFGKSGVIQPYISAGFQLSNFSIRKGYGYQVNADNYRLESIGMNGTGKTFKWTAGTLLNLQENYSLNLFWSYNTAGKIKMNQTYYSSDTRVSLNSWEFGISVTAF